MMKITKAKDIHAPLVQALWNPVIRETNATFNSIEKPLAEITDLINNRPCFLVAIQGETLIGFATFSQFRGGIGYEHSVEHTVMVSPDYQGQGVGHQLMDALETAARFAQHHVLIAGISAWNTQGLSFHKSRGFEPVGHLPQVGRKNDEWLDLVLMQKML